MTLLAAQQQLLGYLEECERFAKEQGQKYPTYDPIWLRRSIANLIKAAHDAAVLT